MACAAALVASTLAAQGSLQGFRLTSSPGGLEDERSFPSDANLCMRVWSERIDETRMRAGTWRLRAGPTFVSGRLTNNRDGSFEAAIDLEQLPARTTWTWSAYLEDRWGRRYAPLTTITLTEPIPPEPVFAIEYGMNGSENAWSQRAIAFADAMMRASEFQCVVDGQLTGKLAPVIPLGTVPRRLGAGWPNLAALPSNERPAARLFGNMAGTVPDGRTTPYVMTWEGTGSCRLVGPLVLAETNRGANRVEYWIDPERNGGNGLLAWILDSSSPQDPVRDVHVWLPGMEAGKPLFWPPFLAKLQAMNHGRGPHTWRTLDWAQIRHYGRTDGPAPFVFDLAGRITPSSPSQGTRRGVCPEFQVALCNAVGANLHLVLPHQAAPISDADYERFVRETLLVIRDGSPPVPGVNGGRPFAGLRSDLTVTLSYSNEIWNSGFPVNGWMRARAQARGRSFHEQIAVECERVFALADAVFSGADAPRLRKFVGGWMADPSYLERVLAAFRPGVRVDAVGPAAYFRPLTETIDRWMAGASARSCPNCPTPDEVVQASLLSIPVIAARLDQHRQLASAYVNPDGTSPVLELYEAGASFIAGYQPWAGAAAEAQRLPAMYSAYVDELVPSLVTSGVALVNWYSFVSSNDEQGGSGAGPFGHWDSMEQKLTLPVPDVYLDEGAPKAAAIYRGPPLR
jgi:hypothetical protein